MGDPTEEASLRPGEVLLALDVGEARIGVARAEVGPDFAFGRGALRRTKQAEDVRRVADLVAAEGAQRLIIGLPRRTDGRDSKQTQRVRAFARALHEVGLRVEFEDERFTTALAERDLVAGGLPLGKRRDKGRVDEASAIAILETRLRRAAEARANRSGADDPGGATP